MYDTAYDKVLVAIARIEEAKYFKHRYPALFAVYLDRQKKAEKDLQTAIKLFASLDR